jgi:hypothetical protein
MLRSLLPKLFDRDDTLPFLNRLVLTVIGRLPPPATIPTAPDGTLSECRVESAPSRSELRQCSTGSWLITW